MLVDVLTYNVHDAFNGDPKRHGQLIDFIEAERPDIAFFGEAFREGRDMDEVLTCLRGLEYRVTAGLYGDVDGREDRHGFIGISRLGHGSSTIRRFGTRNGLHVSSPWVDLYGMHLDDRSESGRLAQARALPEITKPTVVMGDLNAFRSGALKSFGLRALSLVAEQLPAIDPPETKPWLKRRASVTQRFTRMATGSVISELEDYGLHDADPDDLATWRWRPRSSFFSGQLDHIMVTENIRVDKFTLHDDVELSDHMPISARIELP